MSCSPARKHTNVATVRKVPKGIRLPHRFFWLRTNPMLKREPDIYDRKRARRTTFQPSIAPMSAPSRISPPKASPAPTRLIATPILPVFAERFRRAGMAFRSKARSGTLCMPTPISMTMAMIRRMATSDGMACSASLMTRRSQWLPLHLSRRCVSMLSHSTIHRSVRPARMSIRTSISI